MLTYENLTIMYSLPRSMTQWWRWFFSHGCHSLHDPLARCRDPRQLRKLVDAAEGETMFIADTSAIYFHDQLQGLLPGHCRLYMLRDVTSVIESIRRQGVVPSVPALVAQHTRLLDIAWRSHANIRLHYGDLCPDTLAMIFEAVTDTELKQDPAAMLARRIDKPLRSQYRNAADTRSLFSHKDPR